MKAVIEDKIKKLAAVGSMLAEDINIEDIPTIKDMKCVKDFLDLPLNDPKETILKKLVSTAVVVAKKKGVLPFELPKDANEVASMIDDALTRMKVAYKEQLGELDINEAIDKVVDRCAARTIALTEKAVEDGLPVLAEKLATLAMAHPYTRPLAPVIKMVAPYVAPKAKTLVSKGVKKLAECSKPILKNVASWAKERFKTVVAKKKILNRVLLIS